MAINYDYSASRYKGGMNSDKTIALIKTLAYYIALFIMGLVCINMYAYFGKTVITLLVLGYVISALISYAFVPTERPHMLVSLKKNLFMYFGALIVLHMGISVLNGFDANQLSVSLGLSTGQTTTNAYLGWLPMVTQFTMIGTPAALIAYEFKRIMTFYGFGGFGGVTKRERVEQLQRTYHH